MRSRRHPPPTPRRLLAAVLLLVGGAARAHDTWFAPQADARGGAPVLALGTGNQYPVQEVPVGSEYLVRSGCRQGDKPVELKPLRLRDTALLMRAPAAPGQSCWAQLQQFDIELPPDKIRIYLRDINATPAVRAAWADIAARGLPWKERYTKNARIELGRIGTTAPSGMGLDVLIDAHNRAPRVGDMLGFRVLRDGAPLAEQPVELRSARVRVGIWSRTDADGRVQFRVPLPGRWVLRGTELRLSDTEPDTWESRFFTLAFEVHDQKGSSLKSNARSDNQMPATTAIASEPPTNSTRW
jgi:Domain of unknown function (DUF4198)